MGRYSENPRYNVVSTRLSDDELQAVKATGQNVTDFLREAIQEKLCRDELTRIDEALRRAGVR